MSILLKMSVTGSKNDLVQTIIPSHNEISQVLYVFTLHWVFPVVKGFNWEGNRVFISYEDN